MIFFEWISKSKWILRICKNYFSDMEDYQEKLSHSQSIIVTYKLLNINQKWNHICL